MAVKIIDKTKLSAIEREVDAKPDDWIVTEEGQKYLKLLELDSDTFVCKDFHKRYFLIKKETRPLSEYDEITARVIDCVDEMPVERIQEKIKFLNAVSNLITTKEKNDL
jgi:hypothetical protein